MDKQKKVSIFPTAESGYKEETYSPVKDISIEDGIVTIELPDGREIIWFEGVLARVEIG